MVGTLLTLMGFAGAFIAGQKKKREQRAKEATNARTQMTETKRKKAVV